MFYEGVQFPSETQEIETHKNTEREQNRKQFYGYGILNLVIIAV